MGSKKEADLVSAEAPSVIVYVYKGQGDFLPAIPARDLTDVDVANLDHEQIERSGLYEKGVNSVG